MSPRPSVLVLEDDPDVRAMLCDALEDAGYTAHLVADAHAGVQVLRDSPSPMTVLVDVVPVAHWRHAECGVGLLDALLEEGDASAAPRLGRHAYVLMSTNPEQALKLAGAMPLHLDVLAKPFDLADLRASLAQSACGERLVASEPAAA